MSKQTNDRIVEILQSVKCTQQELAANLGYTPGTMTQMLWKLQQEGRISTEPHPLNKTRVYYTAADQSGDSDK